MEVPPFSRIRSVLLWVAVGFVVVDLCGSTFSEAVQDLPSPTEARLRTMSVRELVNLLPKPTGSGGPAIAVPQASKIYSIRATAFTYSPGPMADRAGFRSNLPSFWGSGNAYVLPLNESKQFGAWADKEYIRPAQFLLAVGAAVMAWKKSGFDFPAYEAEAKKRIMLLADRMPNNVTKLPIAIRQLDPGGMAKIGSFVGAVRFPPPWFVVIIARSAENPYVIVDVSIQDPPPPQGTSYTLEIKIPGSSVY